MCCVKRWVGSVNVTHTHPPVVQDAPLQWVHKWHNLHGCPLFSSSSTSHAGVFVLYQHTHSEAPVHATQRSDRLLTRSLCSFHVLFSCRWTFPVTFSGNFEAFSIYFLLCFCGLWGQPVISQVKPSAEETIHLIGYCSFNPSIICFVRDVAARVYIPRENPHRTCKLYTDLQTNEDSN